MILKERDKEEHPYKDKFSIAGAKAEETLGFYLRRVFSHSSDAHVINDLRMQNQYGDAAQIDHLILHRHGFIVVESKSVISTVEVNERAEWTRIWNGRRQGMRSPVQQVKLQIEFLRLSLETHRETLLGMSGDGRQLGFEPCPFDIVVAISDHGQIKRAIEIPEVIKADQVIDRARELIAWRRDHPGDFLLTDRELHLVGQFLLRHHYPRDVASTFRESTSSPPLPAPSPMGNATLGQCEKCGTQCIIKWGRYGYYWKCIRCDNNMPIKEFCPTCRQKMKLRKDKQDFYKRCEICGVEEHFCQFVP